jgi:CheY-like chemotaxis protein
MSDCGVIARMGGEQTHEMSRDVGDVSWGRAGVQEGTSILLVEDDEMICQSLKDWLESVFVDFHIVGASAREATRDTVIESPQMVVVDVALSASDGAGTVRELSRMFPGARIVALAAGGEPELCDALEAAGADACLRLWQVHYGLKPTLRRLLG